MSIASLFVIEAFVCFISSSQFKCENGLPEEKIQRRSRSKDTTVVWLPWQPHPSKTRVCWFWSYPRRHLPLYFPTDISKCERGRQKGRETGDWMFSESRLYGGQSNWISLVEIAGISASEAARGKPTASSLTQHLLYHPQKREVVVPSAQCCQSGLKPRSSHTEQVLTAGYILYADTGLHLEKQSALIKALSSGAKTEKLNNKPFSRWSFHNQRSNWGHLWSKAFQKA